MTAPTQQDDDDLRYPANDPNPFRNEAAETVPVSELMKQVERQRDLAPVRLDVALSVFAAMWVGMTGQQLADSFPNSAGICVVGAIVAALLLVRWTRKR